MFAEGGNPEILASRRSSADTLFVASAHPQPVKAMQVRTKRQFGIGLSCPDEIVGIGTGTGDHPLKGIGAWALPPTRRIGDDGENATLCGVDLQLVRAPSKRPITLLSGIRKESADQR